MKKIILSTVLSFLFTALLSTTGNAQALNSDDIKSQLAADWERSKAYTVEYLNSMPADKYNFRAVDSLRSFSQQMLHLAAANVFLMMTATGKAPLPWASFGLENRASAQSKDSVMYYVTASYDYCADAVRTFDPAKWGEKTKVFNTFETTRFALMNKTFEHQGHHRGQTTVYIRLNNIKPPQEKLF